MKKSFYLILSTLFILFFSAFVFTSCTDAATMDNEATLLGQANLSAGNELELGFNGITGANADPAAMCACIQDKFPTEDLTEAEKALLTFMREEEKLARDVYMKLFTKWDVRVFSNIAKSEQRHMDAILCLLNKYNLNDPAAGTAESEFISEDLTKVYTELIEKGESSLADAYEVGAYIEDLDIADLLKSLEETDNEDITAVLNELLRGSRNHMRAFTRSLNSVDATYTPEFISATLYTEITDTDTERGPGLCGSCDQQGQGKNNKQCQKANNGTCKKGNTQKGNCENAGNGKKGQGQKRNCENAGNGKRGQGQNQGNGRQNGNRQGN